MAIMIRIFGGSVSVVEVLKYKIIDNVRLWV